MEKPVDSEPSRNRLEDIYRNERGTILRRIARTGDVISDAEDVLQDVFVSALRRADALAPVQNLAAWITTAVGNRVVDLWRRGRTRKEAGLVDLSEALFEEVVSEVGLDPLDEFVREELVDELVEAIHALPDKERQVIVAQVFEGRTFKELSERTNTPIETLSARKRAAIRKLAGVLRDWMAED